MRLRFTRPAHRHRQRLQRIVTNCYETGPAGTHTKHRYATATRGYTRRGGGRGAGWCPAALIVRCANCLTGSETKGVLKGRDRLCTGEEAETSRGAGGRHNITVAGVKSKVRKSKAVVVGRRAHSAAGQGRRSVSSFLPGNGKDPQRRLLYRQTHTFRTNAAQTFNSERYLMQARIRPCCQTIFQ